VGDSKAKLKASNKSLAIQLKVTELNRKMQATRKRAHGELANEILRLGKAVKTEKLSYKAFQKMFGKSVGRRAPGMFMEKLRYKAANAGGEVIEFSTRTTALSQRCQCGEKHKKTLNERWHDCPKCGVRAQRDLYSAFLARFVENHRLDTDQAVKAWSGAGILLEQAVSNLKQTTISRVRPASFGFGQSQSGLPVKRESVQHEALDAVACA
jgi:putative transposase